MSKHTDTHTTSSVSLENSDMDYYYSMFMVLKYRKVLKVQQELAKLQYGHPKDLNAENKPDQVYR